MESKMTSNDESQIFDRKLFDDITHSNNVFWAGSTPPLPWITSDSKIINPNYDYRLPENFHQTFDYVFFVEEDLGTHKAWPQIIDEGLRLLAPKGKLLIRFTDSVLCSIFELKNQIFKWNQTEIIFDIRHTNGTHFLSILNKREEKRKVSLNGISFGIITNGNNLENLKNFITSVHNCHKPPNTMAEIVVCGPESSKIEILNIDKDIIFIEEPNKFKEYGWITKKKNLIVEKSSQENLVIVHDRYSIQNDFLMQLKNYGSDFSVLTCRQELKNGSRLPDWVTLGSDWSWTSPGVLDYGDWSRYVFINGGIIIAKKDVLLNVPWNDLLFWNEAEDVELSRRLKSEGYIPRFGRHITAISHPMRKGCVEGFEHLPFLKNVYVNSGVQPYKGETSTPGITQNTIITFSTSTEDVNKNLGIFWCANWALKKEGLIIAALKNGIVSFRLQFKLNHKIQIKIHGTIKLNCIKVYVNDSEQICEVINNENFLIDLDPQNFIFNEILRITFTPVDDDIIIKKINFAQEPSSPITKIYSLKNVKKLLKLDKYFILKLFAVPIIITLIPIYLCAKTSLNFIRKLKHFFTKKKDVFKSKIIAYIEE
jgi:hypothetical protein